MRGKIYIFKKVDNSSHIILIKPNGSEIIDGISSYILRSQWDSISIISDGFNWLTY